MFVEELDIGDSARIAGVPDLGQDANARWGETRGEIGDSRRYLLAASWLPSLSPAQEDDELKGTVDGQGIGQPGGFRNGRSGHSASSGAVAAKLP